MVNGLNKSTRNEFKIICEGFFAFERSTQTRLQLIERSVAGHDLNYGFQINLNLAIHDKYLHLKKAVHNSHSYLVPKIRSVISHQNATDNYDDIRRCLGLLADCNIVDDRYDRYYVVDIDTNNVEAVESIIESKETKAAARKGWQIIARPNMRHVTKHHDNESPGYSLGLYCDHMTNIDKHRKNVRMIQYSIGNVESLSSNGFIEFPSGMVVTGTYSLPVMTYEKYLYHPTSIDVFMAPSLQDWSRDENRRRLRKLINAHRYYDSNIRCLDQDGVTYSSRLKCKVTELD